MTLSIAVVGHGFVGKAVDLAFDHRVEESPTIYKHIIDPKYQTNYGQWPPYYHEIKDLMGQKVDVAFVCVPTPRGKNGSIDASIVMETVDKLLELEDTLIVVKSTITPNYAKELEQKSDRIIFNPEFLTEKNALNDFVNAPMHIFGGDLENCKKLYNMYDTYSQCNKNIPAIAMSAPEASFVKYAINSFLATKVMWFNQLKAITDRHDVNYANILAGIEHDPRMGSTHMNVPGPDGRLGFGGACFPKDVSAFLQFSGMFPLLQDVANYNNKIRSSYDEPTEREKAMGVTFE